MLKNYKFFKQWYLVLLLFELFLQYRTYAQIPTVQDCMGAIPICDSIYKNPTPYNYHGNGNYLNEINRFNDCITPEDDGVWYRFTAQKDGLLRFIIHPDNPATDWDWTIFNLTWGNCSDLKINTQKYVVSSNTYGSFGFEGNTGALSDSSGGYAGHCNGPNENNGPRWNDDIPVFKDNTYLICISNFDKSQYGFTIDFSRSSASIFDKNPPKLRAVVQPPPCNGNYLKVRFSEYVSCQSISTTDFSISGNGVKYKIMSVSSPECSVGALYTAEVTLRTDKPFSIGTYRIRLIDKVNDACRNFSPIDSVDFVVTNLSINNVFVRNVLCTGAGNGSITIDAPGQGERRFYSIDNGFTYIENQGKFTGLKPGDYFIRVRNEFGCEAIAYGKVSIFDAPPLKFNSVSYNNVTTCYGDYSGNISITASGGTGQYLYSIDGGKSYYDNQGYFANIQAKNYTIKVKDSNGCLVDGGNVNMTQPPQIIRNITHSEVTTCYGEKTGTIKMAAINGVGNVYYSIDGGWNFKKNDGYFTQLAAGYYNVKIKDDRNCYAKDTIIQITQPEKISLYTYYTIDVSNCYGDKSGSIIAEGIGGTGILHYSVDNGSTFADNAGKFTNLAAGIYNITMRDNNNCTFSTGQIIINQPSELKITSVTQKNILPCFGNATGEIAIKAEGGNSQITYSIDNGRNFPSYYGYFDRLPAGNYKPVVKNASGCIATWPEIVLTQPLPLRIISIAMSHIGCHDATTGKIVVKADGTGDLYYSIDAGINYQINNGLFENLKAGKYSVRIKDSNGCLLGDSVVTVYQSEKLIIGGVTALEVGTCYGDKSGSILINASGGKGKLIYSLDGGLSFLEDQSNFFKVGVGVYTVGVKDENGCIVTQSQSVTIHQPEKIVIENVIPKDISTCYGRKEGQLRILALGGTGSYTYSVDSGLTYLSNSGQFNNLSAGKYKAVARDQRGCTASFPTLEIHQPTMNQFKNMTITDAKCYGDPAGKIEFTALGGTGEHEFSIDGGLTYRLSTSAFSNLACGVYIPVIRDKMGCVITGDSVQIHCPLPLTFKNIITKNVATCHNDSVGELSVLASGGTGSLVYSIINSNRTSISGNFNRLKAGDYQIMVTDQNQCRKVTEKLTISQPSSLTISSIVSVKPTCYGSENGLIRVTAEGGKGGFSYSIDGGIHLYKNSGNFYQLKSGIYPVVISDTNNCRLYGDTVKLIHPDKMEIKSVIKSDTLSCHGDKTGTVNILTTGGTGLYWFSINNGKDFYKLQNSFSGLSAGTYQILVKDANNCQTELLQTSIHEPPALLIDTIIKSKISCYNFNDATLLIKVKGGVGGFIWSIDGGKNYSKNEGFFKNLSAGIYPATVQDANHCKSATDTIKITNPPAIAIQSIDKKDIKTCAGVKTGQIIIKASGGTGKLIYRLDTLRLISTTGVFNNLPKGNYISVIKDENLCLDSGTVVQITEPARIVIDSIIHSDITCNGLKDGKINVFTSGGTGKLKISMDGGKTFSLESANFLSLSKGKYPIVIQDENSCLNLGDTIEIKEPDRLKIKLDNLKNVSCYSFTDGAIDISVISDLSDNFRYKWSNNHFKQDISKVAAGNYTVLAVDTITKYCAVATYEVKQPEKLIAEIIKKDATCTWTNDGSIDTKISGGTKNYNSIWYNAKGAEEKALFSLLPGKYILQITDKNGCILKDSAIIGNADCSSNVEMYNAFTPNNDGTNDNLACNCKNITEFQITIFNRWGVRVASYFETRNPTFNKSGDTNIKDLIYCWDGKHEQTHRFVPSGAYFYILKAKGYDEKTYDLKGIVYVINK